MRRTKLYIYFYLLALGLPGIGVAGEAYPQVQVIARVNGKIFGYISSSRLAELESDVQTRVGEAFRKSASFPCMEWVPGKHASKAEIRAQLFVDISQRPDQEFSWIDLSFSGAVGDLQPVLLWTMPGVTSTWDRSWSLRQLKGLSDKVVQATESVLPRPELRKAFDAGFIASIPITQSIRVDHLGQRIVAPINAKRLNLEPETLLKLELTASLCPLRPKGGCRIGLLSDDPVDGDLRCRIEKISCCPQKGWSSGIADQLAARKPATARLYLARNHRHCQFGPDNCPGPDEIYRHPGF